MVERRVLRRKTTTVTIHEKKTSEILHTFLLTQQTHKQTEIWPAFIPADSYQTSRYCLSSVGSLMPPVSLKLDENSWLCSSHGDMSRVRVLLNET